MFFCSNTETKSVKIAGRSFNDQRMTKRIMYYVKELKTRLKDKHYEAPYQR